MLIWQYMFMCVSFLVDACKYRILASPLCNVASPMMHAALLTVSTSSIAHIGGAGEKYNQRAS